MRLRIITGIILLLMLAACAPKQPADTAEATVTQAATATSVPAVKRAEVRVSQTSALALPDTSETSIVYGAVEYTNTGNCPVTLIGANFAFTLSNGITLNNSFTPVFSGDDVVAPGEKGYLALWLPYEKALEPGELALSAELQVSPADASSIPLEIRNAFITQNYPGFATVSGAIYNTQNRDCSLNMIYLAFYDEADKLLAVFHFTKDALVPADDFRGFVVHLQALPIENLAERTATIRAHAFGME